MPDVTFVATRPSGPTMAFLSALSDLEGVRLSLVIEASGQAVPDAVRSKISEVVEVPDVADTGQVSHAVEELHRRGQGVSLLLGVEERLELPLAVTRDRIGLPGLFPHPAGNFIDRPRAETVLRRRGLPVAAADGSGRGEGGLVGVVIDGVLAWDATWEEVPPPPGMEGPATPTPWRVVLIPRDDRGKRAGRVRSLAGEALRALGLRDGMCRVVSGVWQGEPALAEVTPWPPEPWMLEAIAWGQGIDPWEAWAEAVVHRRAPVATPTHAVGALVVRDTSHGVEEMAATGPPEVEVRALGPSHAPDGSVERGGALLVRHPDLDAVREALWKILGRYDSVDA